MKLSKIFGMLLDHDNKGVDSDGYGFAELENAVNISTTDPTDKFFYTLYKSGEVTKYDKSSLSSVENLTVDKMPNIGVDYKLYSNKYITTAGYFTFSSVKENTDTDIITSLYDMFFEEALTPTIISKRDDEAFTHIEIVKNAGLLYTRARVLTIPELIKINQSFKELEKKKLPVDFSMTSANSVYVFTIQRRCDSMFRQPDKIAATNFVHSILHRLQTEYKDLDIEYKPMQASKLFW